MQGYTEGQQLRGSDGKIYVVRNGVPVTQAASKIGADPVKVAAEKRAAEDQEFQRQQVAIAAATAARAENNSAQSNAISAQNAALQERKFQAELAQKGLMVGPDGQILPNPNAAASRPGKPMRQGDADKLAEQVDSYAYLKEALSGFQDDYAGNTITGELENWAQGTIGTGTPGQRDWWSNFRTADNLIRNSLFGASLTEGEKKAYEQTTVSPSMTPETVRANLERRLEITRQALQRRTGRLRATFNNEEIDAAVGEFVDDFSPSYKKAAGKDDAPPVTLGGGPSATDKSSRMTGSSQGPQKRLGTERQYSTYDDMAVAQRIEALFDSGASIAQINAEAARLNSSIPPAKVVEAVAWRDGVGKYADRKVYPYNKNTSIVRPDKTGRRSDTEIMMNRALLSPAGTAATTATNALGFGTLENIAPEAIAQQRETNPISAFTGDVAGMLSGTAALAKVGSKVAGKFAPSLLTGGGRAGNVARAVAPDAAYGALYNANIGENPLTGATLGAAGSGAGQLLGKGAQKVLGGVTDPAVQYLTQRNIPLSVGQVLGNRGLAGRTMNKLESLPVVGDLLARNRVEGLRAFEREALNDVVSPIGGKVSQGGAQGLEEAQNAVSGAYDSALSGLNIPGDNQFVQDVGGALAKGSSVPGLGDKFRYAVDNRIGPMFDGGTVSGPELQSALRNLRSIRSDFAKEGPMGQFAADATGQIDDAVTGLVERQAPGVMPKYNAANQAFGRLAPFENARISGINQEAITPAQLGRAVTSGTKNFGGRAKAARGDNLTDLIKYGQEVLPSTIPNSGTADRLGGMGSILLPSALGGSAYGLSTMTENPLLAAPLAVLGMLSTKTGQKAFQAAATKRGKGLKRAGGLFGRRKTQQGLGSAITAPILIGNE